jgi:nicotinate-nucleotide--dimethylbenzimidazole phosphoribosyltransferase
MQVFHIPPAGSPELAGRLKHKIDRKTKPLGALGMLETLALRIGMMQGSECPRIATPHLLVFAGDHGVAASGVSAYPQEVTWQMVMNYLAGGAAVNVFARAGGLELRVIDAGVNHVFAAHPLLIDHKIGMGTKNFTVEPAMTGAQCEAALDAGARLVRSLSVLGCNLVALGEMGIANTTSAAALMAKYTGQAVEACIGRGTGIDDAGLARKREAIRRALILHHAADQPLDILAALGGFEIAMMAGAMLAAAEARMLILVDGFIAGSALLAAQAVNPGVTAYCVFAHQSDEHGHAAMLAHFHAAPLLKLGLRLGEGTGAALALPLVRAACDFLNQMASFESAGVADKA